MGLKAFAAASLAGAANAFFRMPCDGRLVLERADPIVSPGEVSGHVHTISGGNGFGFSMDYEQAIESNCTSCTISHDKSNYWTPALYWMTQDKPYEYEDVPQVGGMTVYYQQRATAAKGTNHELQAFPAGLRMVAGNPFQRSDTGLQQAPGNAVSYVCLDYSGPAHEQTGSIPDYDCPDGLRAQVYFPSCWDGVNNDTDDHHSHMAYPMNGYDNGECPQSHPVPLISIFFEVIYDIGSFSDRWHTVDGEKKHPFVFAQGDKTGYGFHGDFVNGWNLTTLQTAVDECTNDSGRLEDCNVFTDLDLIQPRENQTDCKLPPMVDTDQTTGNMTKLPGCNTPTGLNATAAPEPCTDTPIGKAKTYFTDVTKTLKYAYEGCADDDYYDRTFTGDSDSSDNMTVKWCVDNCKAKGYSLAGLEYARECYCGNDYSNASRAPKAGIMGDCDMKCSGDESDYCGGNQALSVYKACDGGQCNNVDYGSAGSSSANSSSEKRKRHLRQHKHARLHRDA